MNKMTKIKFFLDLGIQGLILILLCDLILGVAKTYSALWYLCQFIGSRS